MPKYSVRDRWGDISLVAVADNAWGGDIEIGFDVSPDLVYFLVVVQYTTGDSFNTQRGCKAYVDLYRTREAAEVCAKRIRAHYDFYKSTGDTRANATKYEFLGQKQRKFADLVFGGNLSVKLQNDAGVEYKTRGQWLGYFESIEELMVKRVQLENKTY